ncbi:MAG: transcriptional antiterminator, Rof [Pseudomonadota bacterium]
MSGYKPVACAVHSAYEVAIMRRRPLQLVWHEVAEIRREVVLPQDLQTRGGAEYLIARREDGSILRLRLDRIDSASPVADGADNQR